ncbi:MAG: TraR/DksA family transcriptional regulator [Pseudomonadota bacterium]
MSSALTRDQKDELALDLSDLQERLEALLNATAAGEQPVKLKDNQGRLTRMDEMHNQSILKANRNVTKNRLRAVIAAQNRLQNESYGTCAECDEPIAFARLKAYPEAPMCIQCQSGAE